MEDRVRDSAIALTDNEVRALSTLRGMPLPEGSAGCVEIHCPDGTSVRAVGDAETVRQAFQFVLDAVTLSHKRQMLKMDQGRKSEESRQVSSDLGRCVIAIPLFLILGAALWMLWASFSNSGKYNPRYGATPNAIHQG